MIRQEDLGLLLEELMILPAETEWVEFKEAKNTFNFEDIGKYFSALSNEANIKDKRCGWLIFGVQDKPRKVVGSRFRQNRADLDSLKSEIAFHTTEHITFMEIYEIHLPEGRVVMLQIPAAPQGIPLAWKGHYYGRTAESVGALNLQEIEQIRSALFDYDWSAQICPGAGIEDLDPDAMARARTEYRNKNPHLAKEVDVWNDTTFLNKIRLTIKGQITRSAIILLGREEAEQFISPAVARITWVLKDEQGMEKDYEHFGPPFLLNTEEAYAKIRNLNYRYLPDNSLFPTEIKQYEPYLIRETLHNCIAHQDYELKGRINIIEGPDELLFTNLGKFLPGSVENVIATDAPPEEYRNPFLANAMVNLNMIDTIGSGIKKMFKLQRQRNFPMPDYDLHEENRVKVRVLGKIINENYTRLLIKRPDLDLKTVMDIDKVQKGIPLAIEDVRKLRSQGLIEGSKSKIYVSAQVASLTDSKSDYIKNRAFDDAHYKNMIIEFLTKFGNANRRDIDKLLIDKLSDVLTDDQKRKKISNLLYYMSRRDRTIKNIGSDHKSIWVLLK
ncbi:MAG TPA: RNA-binding domain-containing protein [Syntrophomonadaceae bacterium]|nr:RNA-binding domain-containing protein [Syntrophomonadaceae bacterium]